MCAESFLFDDWQYILRPRKRHMSEESEAQEPAASAALFPGFAHSLSQPSGITGPLELAESAAAAPPPAPAPSPTPAPRHYLLVADDVARRKKRRLGIAYETPLHRAARYGFPVRA